MTDSVRVREISPGDKLKPFVDLWWKYNGADPAWVAPLRMVVNKALDRRKHPFHKHAEVAYFLAERGGETVGRIAAFVNRLHNDTHGERTGFFGFFEAEDRPETARALVDAARAWLRERGMETMRGPFNFSTNEEVSSPGILIDGFEMPPFVTMSHNPRYYGALMEAAGLAKLKDLVAYRIPSPEAPERLKRGVDAMLKRHGAVIRSIDMKNFGREVGIVKEIYNSAWSLNWGFVPFTDEEFAYVANDMKSIVDPALCLIAEVKGQPVGFSLALPDINQALKHLPSGRLTPLNVLKLLWFQRRVDALRVITLGFRPGYQHQGLGAAFYLKTFLNGAERGYKTAEGSWILEDNWEMRQALDKQGAYVYKTYRIYETAL